MFRTFQLRAIAVRGTKLSVLGSRAMQRFELKLDAAKTWTVMDTSTGLPAKAGDRQLTGLSLDEAQQAMFSANVELLRTVAERRPRTWERKR